MSEMNGGNSSNIKNGPLEGSIFSRIRTFNHHALNSLGFLFSSSDHVDPHEQRFDNNDDDIHSQKDWDPASGLIPSDMHSSLVVDEPYPYPANDRLKIRQNDSLDLSSTHTPTPSRPITPQNRLSDVKQIFSLGRDYQPTMSRVSLRSTFMLSEPEFDYYCNEDSIPLEQISKSRHLMLETYPSAEINVTASSDIDETPPLSPDTDDSSLTYSLTSFRDLERFERDLEVSEHSLEVREGKKPERPICFDTLIEDIAPYSAETNRIHDNDDGWYGLEYTLELSVKERRASETYSCDEPAGEFSKSHESWAALRKGAIHPFLEDDDYYQWKSWHHYLDREDERRRQRKAQDFEAHSKDMAWLYMAEMKTRDVYYWQLEVYGMVGDDVREHLASIAEHRKDSFYPTRKHNLGWYLKRSRSIASLRELKPVPFPILRQ